MNIESMNTRLSGDLASDLASSNLNAISKKLEIAGYWDLPNDDSFPSNEVWIGHCHTVKADHVALYCMHNGSEPFAVLLGDLGYYAHRSIMRTTPYDDLICKVIVENEPASTANDDSGNTEGEEATEQQVTEMGFTFLVSPSGVADKIPEVDKVEPELD